MDGWHHRLDGHELEWTPGVGDGQGGLACCDSWGRKKSDTTEWLNWLKILLNRLAEGNGTPVQYSCLENPMDGGAWKAAVHGIAEGRTWLSDFTFTFYFHALEKEMATHSSVLAWRIPGTGHPGGLPSMGSHRVRHDWSDSAAELICCQWWLNQQIFLKIWINLHYNKIIAFCPKSVWLFSD